MPLLKEIRELPPAVPTPPGLFDVPGGWTERVFPLLGHEVLLTLPAVPDDFLDDPQVLAANERDGYMPYWSYLWPAAIEMARSLAGAPWPAGTRVLELGSGVGLVGLTALARGDRVTFSDYEPLAVELCRYNAARNGWEGRADGEVLDWRTPAGPSFPVVIGSEVLYEERNHAPLLDLLSVRLEKEGVCWFGDAGRTRAEVFFHSLDKTPFRCRLLDEAGRPLPQPRFGRYQLFELRWA